MNTKRASSSSSKMKILCFSRVRQDRYRHGCDSDAPAPRCGQTSEKGAHARIDAFSGSRLYRWAKQYVAVGYKRVSLGFSSDFFFNFLEGRLMSSTWCLSPEEGRIELVRQSSMSRWRQARG